MPSVSQTNSSSPSADILWQRCQQSLQEELPLQQFNTWIRPLRHEARFEELRLLAPNRFIKDWVADKFLARINQLITNYNSGVTCDVVVEVAVAVQPMASFTEAVPMQQQCKPAASRPAASLQANVAPPANEPVQLGGHVKHDSKLIEQYNFDSFVEGKSNQFARAAAMQVAENPGGSNNPLFLYGGVGLGKTHLMHSVGNAMLANNKNARIVYLHSERFVADMVKALQLNAINDFKRFYRSVDALLIDDIQFFAGKERSQEEFFHTRTTIGPLGDSH